MYYLRKFLRAKRIISDYYKGRGERGIYGQGHLWTVDF